MKWFIIFFLIVSSASSFAIQCKELLTDKIVAENIFTAPLPDGMRLVDLSGMSSRMSPQLKSDIKALATVVLQNHLNNSPSARSFIGTEPIFALQAISRDLFSITLRRLEIRYAAMSGVNISSSLSFQDGEAARMEIYFQSSIEQVLTHLMDHRAVVENFIRDEISNIIADAENNVDTGLWTPPSAGRRD